MAPTKMIKAKLTMNSWAGFIIFISKLISMRDNSRKNNRKANISIAEV
jgi:hypothetical protein